MDKDSQISEILNWRTENSLFIDIERKNIKTNLSLLKKLHNENLLDKFLQDYFRRRMETNNYPKRVEFIMALESYKNVLNGDAFLPDTFSVDDDKLKERFNEAKNNLMAFIKNYNPII